MATANMRDTTAATAGAPLRRRTRRRRGFTLVELVVVVLVIGILVMLLLPAVQAAREAARRAACASNLTQLIVAVHSYEAAHRVFPPGTIDATGPIANGPRGYHHGWIEQLLPFLEREALYHHVDRDVGVYHKTNRPLRRLEVSTLNCPSSPLPGPGYSHYAAVHHDLEAPIDVDQHGVFFLNSRVRRRDVGDGLGQTLFMGEKVLEAGDLGWLSGTRATLRNTGERLNLSHEIASLNWNAVPRFPPGTETDAGFSLGEPGGDDELPFGSVEPQMGDDAVGGPDGSEPAEARARRAAPRFVGGFASFHPGGASFAFGDGAIRFLPDTISLPVYRQMGHRDDSQPLDLDFD